MIRQQLIVSRKSIKDIPIGSWEKKIPTPPASDKTVSETLTDIHHDNNHKLAEQTRKRNPQRRRK